MKRLEDDVVPPVVEEHAGRDGPDANDLVRRVPIRTFRSAYDRLLTEIQHRVHAPIVVSNLPDVSLVPLVMLEVRGEVAARVKSYNDTLDDVARIHGATVFDVAALSRRMVPEHPEFVSPDGFHPSDHGYEAWATEMWPLIRRLLIHPKR